MNGWAAGYCGSVSRECADNTSFSDNPSGDRWPSFAGPITRSNDPGESWDEPYVAPDFPRTSGRGGERDTGRSSGLGLRLGSLSPIQMNGLLSRTSLRGRSVRICPGNAGCSSASILVVKHVVKGAGEVRENRFQIGPRRPPPCNRLDASFPEESGFTISFFGKKPRLSTTNRARAARNDRRSVLESHQHRLSSVGGARIVSLDFDGGKSRHSAQSTLKNVPSIRITPSLPSP